MLTVIRKILTRLTTPLKTASYACGKCGFTVEVTDYPDRVDRALDIGLTHTCRPKPKTL
ncbi:hypothetical protein ACF1D2_29715 [Streptomyces bacillaris]|uniref:hypothetical protein n=1 Tax=Streptomyces bacillaris TaxID=68179 RepID=UPI0036F75D85